MSLLWEEDDLLMRRGMDGEKNISDTQQNTLVNRLSQLPFTQDLKYNAWYKLMQYRSAKNLHVQDWQSYESLIPFIPSDILQNVNFSDDYIIDFFGKQRLEQNQLAIVAETVAETDDEEILDDEDRIMKMGNIFCGFSREDLAKMNRTVLRSLLHKEFFQKISGCSLEQLQIIKESMLSYTVIGPPSIWKPETVKLAGSLVAALDSTSIRHIRDKSIAFITPEIISITPLEVLKNLRIDQLRSLNRESLLSWRRKTRDLRHLYGENHDSSPSLYLPKIHAVIILSLVVHLWNLLWKA